jgi:hypothetical protein
VVEHAVLIAAADLLPALKAHLPEETRETLAFSDAEALRALETITTRRPAIVWLERRFAASPRGAALVNRITADPSLAETQIRVVNPDGSPATETAPPTPTPKPKAKAASAASKKIARDAAPAASPLDFRGTRRAPRFRIVETREILVDGNRAMLVDLSTLGAQLITATVLKPNQRVRVSLSDEERPIRCTATVVWASFEIPKGSNPRYRAGLDFIEPDAGALDAFIRRHKND